MPIFRVHGTRIPGGPGTVMIECASETQARAVAAEEGYGHITLVELVEGSPEADDTVRRPPRVIGQDPYDKLREKPVLTIAQGVLLGLLMWAGLMLVVGFALGLVT